MFKVPDHQVAGHQAGNGKLGPLIDDSGRFYKPLQENDRGSKEVAFYESFSSNVRVPNSIRRFFPVYYGTQALDASDGSGQHPHMILEDVVSGCLNPSIMDIKIGSRTWYPQASDAYVQKCFEKDRGSTSVTLGFRISGFRVFQGKEWGFYKPEKKLVKSYTVEDVRVALKEFVSVNLLASPDSEPVCSLAQSVYGGPDGILAQLLELKAWFEDQTMYHFNSCSVLMLYEKEPLCKERSGCAKVKLVDFAHVVEGNGVIDHNFLGGLCSLIKFISDILSTSEENSTKPLSDRTINNGFDSSTTEMKIVK